jgi:uncharacterized protein
MQVGTAESSPSELVTGWLNVTDLPTGTPERLPVLIAEGEEDGPTLWITASIHGNEVTALATAQDVMRDGLESKIRGTVVCLPNLNPAGLRRTTRTSYYHGDDPNRYFPDPDADGSRPPRVQELINERVFDAFADSADALVDLHTAQVGSIPFVIRDRVLYGNAEPRSADDRATTPRGTERDEDDARDLADELERFVDAYDFPVINEYAAEEYVEQNLQRSTAGAALNSAGIPAFTVELGGFEVVEEDTREKGVVGLLNVMRELDMLPGGVEPTGLDAPVDFPVKRAVHPHTETAGIVRHRVEAGETFEEGDVIADIVTPHGEPKAVVETDHDGYVVGRYHGVAAYENDPVTSLAVRDDGDLVVPRSRE